MVLYAVENAIIIAVVLTFIFAACRKYVNKYRVVIYAIALVFAAYIICSNLIGYDPIISGTLLQTFTLGALANILFAVVAYIGVLPDKWKVTRRLKGVRAELSVTACIFAFAHTLYFSYYFIDFFTDPGSLEGYYQYACIASLILDCLMVPLMLTSFYSVRKFIKAKTWKRLQQFSYVFYLALLLHVWGLYAESWGTFGSGDGKTLLYYTVIWVVYYVLRIVKYVYDRWAKNAKAKGKAEPAAASPAGEPAEAVEAVEAPAEAAEAEAAEAGASR